MKMKQVYESNPALGDPMSIQGQLTENGHRLDKLRSELKKFQVCNHKIEIIIENCFSISRYFFRLLFLFVVVVMIIIIGCSVKQCCNFLTSFFRFRIFSMNSKVKLQIRPPWGTRLMSKKSLQWLMEGRNVLPDLVEKVLCLTERNL